MLVFYQTFKRSNFVTYICLLEQKKSSKWCEKLIMELILNKKYFHMLKKKKTFEKILFCCMVDSNCISMCVWWSHMMGGEATHGVWVDIFPILIRYIYGKVKSLFYFCKNPYRSSYFVTIWTRFCLLLRCSSGQRLMVG